jgi:hypothetical protein
VLIGWSFLMKSSDIIFGCHICSHGTLSCRNRTDNTSARCAARFVTRKPAGQFSS